MLCTLKVPIHNIKVGPSSIPKASPDHNLHIVIRTICLDHSWLPLLCCCPEAPFVSFAPPPLCRALITPYIHPPLLWSKMTVSKAPSKAFIRILLSKKGSPLTLPILNPMFLQDLLDSSLLK